MRCPKYRLHKATGKAVVTFNGTDFYLGEHNSADSHLLYQDLCRQYLTSGGNTPVRAERPVVTVSQLGKLFQIHAAKIYADSPNEKQRFAKLADILDDMYGDTPANAFGPRALRDVRDHLVTIGNSREYINRQIRCIVRIFKWGVSEEWIEHKTFAKLETLETLRKGQTSAKRESQATARPHRTC